MKKLLKIVGLLLVLVVAGAAVFVATHKPAQRPTTDLKVEVTPERVARGRYLTEHVLGCVACHSNPDLKLYGLPPREPHFAGTPCWGEDLGMPGTVCPSNLTPDVETGLGSWTDDEILRAFREGIRKDGTGLFPMMPYTEYRHISDEDAHSVVAYLRSLPPAKNAIPRSEIRFPVSFFVGMVPEPITEPVQHPDRANRKAWGAYMAQIAGCRNCHTPVDDKHRPIEAMAFAGGQEWNLGSMGRVRSANITPHPTGSLPKSKEAFLGLFRSFQDREAVAQPVKDGRITVMPWLEHAHMTDEDLGAIYDHLSSLPGIENTVVKHPQAEVAGSDG